jgi:oligoribonuclease (3'-5' exoribonuclease)
MEGTSTPFVVVVVTDRERQALQQGVVALRERIVSCAKNNEVRLDLLQSWNRDAHEIDGLLQRLEGARHD